MGWKHPEISLADLMKLIKGFVDIVIVASGYQSSGLIAHWDAPNIKKAFQWALFFENVLRRLSSSNVYQDSMKELNDALSEVKAHPCFPQGLAYLSSATLTRVRDFVVQHFIHTLPLRVPHLRALMTAAMEMEFDNLSQNGHDCLLVYLKKLSLQNASPNSISQDITPTTTNELCTFDDFTELIVQKLLHRQSAVSCLLSAVEGLDILSNSIRCRKWDESYSCLFEEQIKHENDPVNVEQLIEFNSWNNWKSRSLSYFLDKKTVRLVSGASMIFSAPKVQWVQVIERLNSSTEGSDDVSDIIELLLLGCMANRWSFLIDSFMSVSYESLSILKQYDVVCRLLLGRSQSFYSKENTVNSMESGILEYLTGHWGSQFHHIWKLSPTLAAAAIPSWSPLFRLYLSQIENQLRGDSSTLRCCSCAQHTVNHINCELAERIWCLYIFHVYISHMM